MKDSLSLNIFYGALLYFQVCAPTGAGKTNIAMISILHEVCYEFAASLSRN